MAYVRKTETLVVDIMRQISNMREAAKEPYATKTPEYGTPAFAALREAAEAAAWVEAPELRGKLPDQWLSWEDDIQLNFFKTADGKSLTRTILNFPENDRFGSPYPVSRYTSLDLNVLVGDCPKEAQDWVQNTIANEATRQDIDRKYGDVASQIRLFLGSQPSLNRAIKEMPELELYVPQSYLAKLREPTPSRRQETQETKAPQPVVDREQIAALGIAHRVAQANN